MGLNLHSPFVWLAIIVALFNFLRVFMAMVEKNRSLQHWGWDVLSYALILIACLGEKAYFFAIGTTVLFALQFGVHFLVGDKGNEDGNKKLP